MKKTCTRLLLSALAVTLTVPGAALAQSFFEDPQPGSVAEHAAKEYRKQARYPGNSKVLEAGIEDPVRAKLRVDPVTSRQRQDEVTSLTVRTAQLSYEPGETVEVFVTAEGSEVVSISGELTDGARTGVGSMSFFDDGVGSDKRARDGIFTGSFDLAESVRPDLAEVHTVRVYASFANGEQHEVAGGFILSNPWSRLTGRYRDRVENGNVVISAEVGVTRPGRFHLMGTLYTLGGEPIGTAQAAEHLDVGKHWIDLSFYGLMFHDRKAAGPYRLGSLALRTTGGMPNAINGLVEDAYVTRTVAPLSQLTSAPANDASLIRAAESLEATLSSRGER